MVQESDKTPNGSHLVWKPGSLLFTTYSLNTLVFFLVYLLLVPFWQKPAEPGSPRDNSSESPDDGQLVSSLGPIGDIEGPKGECLTETSQAARARDRS